MLKKLAIRAAVALAATLPLLAQPAPAAASTSGALFALAGSSQNQLMRVDIAAGTATLVADLSSPPAPGQVDSGQVVSITGDPATHRIFGTRQTTSLTPQGQIHVDFALLTVNSQTGVFTVAPNPNPIALIGFDSTSGSLLGLGSSKIVRVDPSTGATTPLVTLSIPCCAILTATLAADIHTVYVGVTPFFPDPTEQDHTILTVDLSSGNVTSSPTAPGLLRNLSYDSSTKLLLTNDANSLFKIDPSTGNETAIATFNTDLTRPVAFGGAVDPNTHTAFINEQISFFPQQQGQFFAIDDQSGAVTASPVFPIAFFSMYFEAPPQITPDSIIADVKSAQAGGAISNPGVATSLLAKLDEAKAARARGQCGVAADLYRAFVNEVGAQSGRTIGAATAAQLSSEAQFLIANCP